MSNSPFFGVALRSALSDYRYGFIDKQARILSINEMTIL